MPIPHPIFWVTTIVLVVAAVIDGKTLKVPNWLTFPLAACGLAWWGLNAGWHGLGWALVGLIAGLVPLLLVYAIGGMGAGDVKLMAALGAWIGAAHVFWVFVISALIGGVIAAAIVFAKGRLREHVATLQTIGWELASVRDPVELAQRATARKPQMTLLPYGIPIALGAIAYFAFSGLYV